MASVVNLNRFRKRKGREEARRAADANAVKHGERRRERAARKAREALEAERLDGARRDPPKPPSSGPDPGDGSDS